MSSFSSPNYTHLLQAKMQQVGVSSFRELSRLSEVSERQIMRLRQGDVLQMRLEILLKLSQTLQISLNELLTQFSTNSLVPVIEETTAFKQEYRRLQQQMERQREQLMQEFQQSSLTTLESWLTYWQTAVAAAKENPQLPAIRIIPLVKPVEQLLQEWGVSAIASVGEEIPYNPQYHQLIEGSANPGDAVKVRNVGYRHGEKLLFRAKVSSA